MEKQILREKITQLSHKVNKIERDFYDKDLNVPFNNKIIVSGFKSIFLKRLIKFYVYYYEAMKPEKINELDTQPKKNYVVKENPKTEIEKEKERKEPLDNKLFVKNKFDSDQCLNNLISEKKIEFLFENILF